MSLINLIKDQTIKIDDHKAGAREIKQWDDERIDVHIHKSTNFPIEGKRQKIDIKIPINTNRPLSVTARHNAAEIPRKLEKEIIEAFKDVKIRGAFVEDLLKNIESYQTALSSEKRAKDVLERISKHFGLEWVFDIKTKHINGSLLSLTLIYKNKEDNTEFFSKIDYQQITIGQKMGMRNS